ncbi:hypothetical protein GZL_01643 [Streptomyces sp. 769]|nr:hypothetical protein GZL_01643 [Streptomyces sp. 769]
MRTAPFTGLSPHSFGRLVTMPRRDGADAVRRGRLWSLLLGDRVLLVAAYRRTNLTLRQLAPPFGTSKSAADRIINHLGPLLALQPHKRFRKDAVLIMDVALVPTRDHAVAEQPKNTATPPTSRSSSTPIPVSSWWSAGLSPATAMTARHGHCLARRMPSGTPR